MIICTRVNFIWCCPPNTTDQFRMYIKSRNSNKGLLHCYVYTQYFSNSGIKETSLPSSCDTLNVNTFILHALSIQSQYNDSAENHLNSVKQDVLVSVIYYVWIYWSLNDVAKYLLIFPCVLFCCLFVFWERILSKTFQTFFFYYRVLFGVINPFFV